MDKRNITEMSFDEIFPEDTSFSSKERAENRDEPADTADNEAPVRFEVDDDVYGTDISHLMDDRASELPQRTVYTETVQSPTFQSDNGGLPLEERYRLQGTYREKYEPRGKYTDAKATPELNSGLVLAFITMFFTGFFFISIPLAIVSLVFSFRAAKYLKENGKPVPKTHIATVVIDTIMIAIGLIFGAFFVFTQFISSVEF